MSSKLKFVFCAASVLALVSLVGCNRDRCCCGESAAPAIASTSAAPPITVAAPREVSAPVAAMPNVTGHWEGRWESGGHPGHGGGLKCDATATGPEKWAAVFTAEFGQVKAYEVKLDGKPGNGAVLFGGKVDLGAKDGGVFTWTGQATASEFTGKYEGGGDTGSFKMSKK